MKQMLVWSIDWYIDVAVVRPEIGGRHGIRLLNNVWWS